jgi:opacity protein-like surface antigen
MGYNYRLQQESWLLMSKADIYKWKRFMPYVALGLGASFNRISQLFLNSTMFSNQLGGTTNLTSDFSYNLGIGLDYQVMDDFWLTLGYFYDNFGKNKVGIVYTNNNFTSVGTLENANLHSNSAFLNAHYLFW